MLDNFVCFTALTIFHVLVQWIKSIDYFSQKNMCENKKNIGFQMVEMSRWNKSLVSHISSVKCSCFPCNLGLYNQSLQLLHHSGLSSGTISLNPYQGWFKSVICMYIYDVLPNCSSYIHPAWTIVSIIIWIPNAQCKAI